MSALEKPVYRFGEFELDPRERRLLARGESVTLTPKVFDTLVLLVERAGHVVGKDELMQALWPRGFVDESNLTKHIWLIRKALGDGEHEARCIETVPKRGYRFVAPVSHVDQAQGALSSNVLPAQASAVTADVHGVVAMDAWTIERDGDRRQHVADPHANTNEPMPPRNRTLIMRMIAMAAIVAAAAAWLAMNTDSSMPAQGAPGSAVAIAAFSNLSQNTKDAWLGPALGEMLATEIAAGGRVHVLPDELVRPARADLAAPLAGGYAQQSLTTLRKRLGADYVLSGGYLVSGASEQPQLRLDLALQDARTGIEIARLARSGAVADLPALVIQAGASMRERLGIPSASHGELEQMAAAQPPTADVARRIGFALDALHRNDPARARDELLDAVAQAPGYAPAYLYLAQAWSELGYTAKALAAAQQAAAHMQGLPEEQRLQIATQVSLQEHDGPKAIENARASVTLRPQNPEYRFQLVAVLVDEGKPDIAQTELAALTRLPGQAMDDPRLELMQARIAGARDDSKQRAVHAERALQQARLRDETGIAAEAGTQLGVAHWRSGDLATAEQILKQARADYASIGNPHGEARADQNIGNIFADNDATRARESYQRALATYQGIGDRNGEAAIYSDLARMLWASGDHDGAETAVRKSLAIRRETADLAGQAWNLAALASIELDSAASDEVAANFREAIRLDEQVDERSHRAFTLMQYSDLLRLRGELQQAAATCALALQGYRQTGDADGIAQAEYQCAQIALDRGEVDAARDGAARARADAASLGNTGVVVNSDLLMAQIRMGQGDFSGALAHVEDAAQASPKAELVTGDAIAQSQLATCYAALGRNDERDRALARAKDLRSRITEREEVFAVDIALARLRGQGEQQDAAAAALRELVADADRRQWLAWSLESRLALVQLLESRDDPSAPVARAALAETANVHGYAWIAQRLHARKPDQKR